MFFNLYGIVIAVIVLKILTHTSHYRALDIGHNDFISNDLW